MMCCREVVAMCPTSADIHHHYQPTSARSALAHPSPGIAVEGHLLNLLSLCILHGLLIRILHDPALATADGGHLAALVQPHHAAQSLLRAAAPRPRG